MSSEDSGSKCENTMRMLDLSISDVGMQQRDMYISNVEGRGMQSAMRNLRVASGAFTGARGFRYYDSGSCTHKEYSAGEEVHAAQMHPQPGGAGRDVALHPR